MVLFVIIKSAGRSVPNHIKKKEMPEWEHFLCFTCGIRYLAASQEGIEPPTYSLGGCRSILLSYWDMMVGYCGI